MSERRKARADSGAANAKAAQAKPGQVRRRKLIGRGEPEAILTLIDGKPTEVYVFATSAKLRGALLRQYLARRGDFLINDDD